MFDPSIVLVPVKWGPFISASGETPRSVTVHVVPDFGSAGSLVWASTGSVLTSVSAPAADRTAPVEFSVPAVDQVGWRTSAGADPVEWVYEATARVDFGTSVVSFTKRFRALSNMASLDLALVPDGSLLPIPAPPVPPVPDPGWQRPTNWPVMPDLVDGMFTAVFEVPNAIDPAPVELTFPDGPFSVDWLDGSPVESFGAGDTASHVYSVGIQGLVVSGAVGLPDAEVLLGSAFEVRFKEDNLTSADDLLSMCFALQSVSLDLPALTSADSLLSQCFALQSVSLDLPALTSANGLLGGCTALQSVTLDLPALTSANGLLPQCFALQSVSLDLPALTSADSLLSQCFALQSVSLDLPALTSADSLLSQCFALQSVSLDLPAITSAYNLLGGCFALQSVTLDLPALTSADSLLAGCTALQSVTLDLPALTSADSLLAGCTALQSVTLDLPALTSSLGFYGRERLQKLTASGYTRRIKVDNTALSTQDLNALFTGLGTVDPGDNITITITGARGAATADTSIATAKGWTVTN
jgi:hypothetical protein